MKINLFKAEYIFRLDDIHPEMDWNNFYHFKSIFDKYGVKPIIAVIPNNINNFIRTNVNKKSFWEEISKLKDDGWIIAMHGFDHKYITNSSGILKINKFSEFSGLPYDLQHKKIKDGKDILNKNGIYTDIFIAPAHSFDKNTCRALSAEGFNVISDGISFWPYFKYNLLWIPQIAWKMRRFFFGLITFCLHINSFSESEFKELDLFLTKNRNSVFDLKTLFDNKIKKTKKFFLLNIFLKIYFYFKFGLLKIFSKEKNSPFESYVDVNLKYTDPKNYEDRIYKTQVERYNHNIWFNFLVEQLSEKTENKIVADLGCGTGVYLKYCNKAKKIYAIDISNTMITYAKKQWKDNKNISFFEESSLNTSIKSNSIDVVILFGILDYVDKDKQLLEVGRILKNNGKVLILVPNRNNPLNFLITLKHYFKNEKTKEFLTHKELKKILIDNGFSIILTKNMSNIFYLPAFFGDSSIYFFKVLEFLYRPLQEFFPIGANLYFYVTKK